jgi:exonuclease VII small subunit
MATLPLWQPAQVPPEYEERLREESTGAQELMKSFDFLDFLRRVHPDGISHAIEQDRSFEARVHEFVEIVRQLNYIAQLDVKAARALWSAHVPARVPYLTFLDPSMETFEAKYHELQRRIDATGGSEHVRLEASNRTWMKSYAASRVLFLPLFASTPRAAFVGDTISPDAAPQ